MKTFSIVNGDLALTQSSYDLISGQPKLKQDLAIALEEPYGSDRNHPRWGSLLVSYVGQPLSSSVQAFVQAEVDRIVTNYMALQQAAIQRDQLNNVQSRYGTDEVISKIIGITVRQSADQLLVQVALQTLAGLSMTVTRIVGV